MVWRSCIHQKTQFCHKLTIDYKFLTNQYFSYIFWLYLIASAYDILRALAIISIFSLFFMLLSTIDLFILLPTFTGLNFCFFFLNVRRIVLLWLLILLWLLLTFNKTLSIPSIYVILIQGEVQMFSTLPVMRELSVFFGVVIAHSTEGTFSKWLISNSCVTDEGTLFHTTSVLISLVLFKASFLSLNFFHLFLRLCSNLLWSSEYFFSVNRHIFVSAFPEIFH